MLSRQALPRVHRRNNCMHEDDIRLVKAVSGKLMIMFLRRLEQVPLMGSSSSQRLQLDIMYLGT